MTSARLHRSPWPAARAWVDQRGGVAAIADAFFAPRASSAEELDEARELLAYWEHRARRLPRWALMRRREAREMAARWRERARAAEERRYGRGLLGAASLYALERRAPTTLVHRRPACRAGGRICGGGHRGHVHRALPRGGRRDRRSRLQSPLARAAAGRGRVRRVARARSGLEFLRDVARPVLRRPRRSVLRELGVVVVGAGGEALLGRALARDRRDRGEDLVREPRAVGRRRPAWRRCGR